LRVFKVSHSRYGDKDREDRTFLAPPHYVSSTTSPRTLPAFEHAAGKLNHFKRIAPRCKMTVKATSLSSRSLSYFVSP